jgi:hypothetical protein
LVALALFSGSGGRCLAQIEPGIQGGAAEQNGTTAEAEPTSTLVPADMCATGTDETQKGKTHFPSYLNDSFSQLKSEAPLLRVLKFEADPAAEPSKSDEILKQTGVTITAMLPRVPNLIAREELAQATLALPYMVQETQVQSAGSTGVGGRRNAGQLYESSSHSAQGDELQKVLNGMLTSGKHAVFGYRIQSIKDPTYGTVLNEYRTNDQNESVDVMNMSPGNPRGVCFSSSWMMFKPANALESNYRYLWHQRVGKHDTVVLAFAQVPGEVLVPAEISMGGPTCSYLMQGVVWIDEAIFQIVRVQTDLLAALPGLHVTELRSEVSFGEVRIAERDLTLWMPSDVSIHWVSKDQVGEERH